MLFTGRVVDWLQRIRAGFDAMPDRRYSLDEAAATWDLDPQLLKIMLDALVDVGFLQYSADGSYARRRRQEMGREPITVPHATKQARAPVGGSSCASREDACGATYPGSWRQGELNTSS